MSSCERLNCGYYYKTEEDLIPCCHYPSDDPYPAPCEYEEEEDE